MNRRDPLAVGIDLGTTYSVIAYLDESGRPQTLTNAEGERLTASAVFFEGDDVVVGREALRALGSDPQQVAIHAKRELGQRVYPHVVGGRNYPPEAIQAWILNKLRQDASRQIGSFSKVVITVPAYFDEVRRKATQDAGYMAGLDVIDIINEPTAAALAFGQQLLQRSAESQRLLVYDLGGGTFDVTVLEWSHGAFTVLATDGDVHLGGLDWDQRLLDQLASEFQEQFHLDPREDANTRARWWRECEETKRTLSVRPKATFVCDCGGQPWRREILREEFRDWTRDLVERTRFTVAETVAASGLTWHDFNDILLVGGSTRLPAIQEMLRDLSHHSLNVSLSPDEAIAQGAAIRAGLALNDAAKRPLFTIRDVNSHSLGVSGTDSLTQQQRVAILIPRNTPLPASARRVFKTQKDDQRSVLIPILEGESTNPAECIPLGQCIVRELPRDLPAQTPVEVLFEYQRDGRLTVTVRIIGTETDLTHEIVRENSLSREQLIAWREHIARLPAENRDDS